MSQQFKIMKSILINYCSLYIQEHINSTNASLISHYFSYRGCLLNVASVLQEYLYIFQSFNSLLKICSFGWWW